MSLLGIAAAVLIPGAGAVALRFLAPVVFGRVAGGAVAKARAIDWKVAAPLLLALAAVVYILILRGEVRHRDKTIAGQAAWEQAIVGAVSKGVGRLVPKDHAAAQIEGAFANVATLNAAIDRQNQALRQSAVDAEARDTAAKAAAEPTPDDKARDVTRKALSDPKRSTGLSEAEWGQL